MASPSSSNSEKIPYTNLIYNSFKMEAKYMKTSHSRAWECNTFTLEFIGFHEMENMVMELQSNT